MQGKNVLEKTSYGVWDALYKDFILRDLVGYVLSGYIMWAALLHREIVSLVNGKFSNIPSTIEIGIVLISLPCAFVTGRALYTLGRIMGIIRNYPLLESAKKRNVLQKRFLEMYARDSSEYRLRERYLSLKLASGTNGLAILLCATYFTYKSIPIVLPIFIIWVLGFLLIFDHFRTQQRQWDFEKISIGEETSKNNLVLSFSIIDVLTACIFYLAQRAKNIIKNK